MDDTRETSCARRSKPRRSARLKREISPHKLCKSRLRPGSPPAACRAWLYPTTIPIYSASTSTAPVTCTAHEVFTFSARRRERHQHDRSTRA
eukprot:30918-Pelagococcus_subviridis.AAC.68